VNYFGGGCTWQRTGDSPLDNYTISHEEYSAFFSRDADVQIRGNECEGTVLHCKGGDPIVQPSPPADDGVSQITLPKNPPDVLY
jgi:hypothetical protein